MPAATQTLLDEAHADVDEWLADKVEASFRRRKVRGSCRTMEAASPKVFSAMI